MTDKSMNEWSVSFGAASQLRRSRPGVTHWEYWMVSVTALCVMAGCGQLHRGSRGSEKVLSGHRVFMTWSTDQPRPRLFHVVIVPKGVPMPVYSWSRDNLYKGREQKGIRSRDGGLQVARG